MSGAVLSSNRTSSRGRPALLWCLLSSSLITFFLASSQHARVAVVVVDAQQQDLPTYDGCDVTDYYFTNNYVSDLSSDEITRSSWTRASVGTLLKHTHQNVIPYTHSTKIDVWDALGILDSHDHDHSTTDATSQQNTTVRLIYSQRDVPAQLYGTADTWNREHIWPKSHGVGKSGPDFSDLHHLKASDWNVNAARSNLYFGECRNGGDGSGDDDATCDTPAHNEAAGDTSKDSVVFRPPAVIRGDVARAIFYMNTRYFGDDGDPNLLLTDCPSDLPNDNDDANNHEMAYLSQLIQWHYDDPVDDYERQRNDLICQHYQGNRNPFIDGGDKLVEVMYGQPQQPQQMGGDGGASEGSDTYDPNYYGYASCSQQEQTDDDNDNESPTPPPSTAPPPLRAGDVMVIAWNADNPDTVALVALRDLTTTVVNELYLTDNAWNGTAFRNGEGSIKLSIPEEGIPAGTVFGYESSPSGALLYSDRWESVTGSFALAATNGDNVFVYGYDDDGNIVFVNAITLNNDEFLQPGLEWNAYGSSATALPTGLFDNFTILADNADNALYRGIVIGTKQRLQRAIHDPKNWVASKSERQTTNGDMFTVRSSGASKAGEGSSLRQIAWLVAASIFLST